MADRLNPKIMEHLTKKTGKTKEKIGPRIAEIRKKYPALTIDAAAQVYAEKKNTSVLAKLTPEDRQTLASIQIVTQLSVSNTSKVDKRTLNINNSSVQNLSFGDRTQVSQNVIVLDKTLDYLLNQIDASEVLTDEEKNDHKSDIQTIATQVGKSKPNRKIISSAWEGVKGLASIEGFAQAITRVAPLIEPFLG